MGCNDGAVSLPCKENNGRKISHRYAAGNIMIVDIGGRAPGWNRLQKESDMRVVPLVAGLLLVGCQGVNGPFAHKAMPQRVDDPCLSIAEQQQRGRDRLALPEQSPQLGPRTWMEPPGAGAYGR